MPKVKMDNSSYDFELVRYKTFKHYTAKGVKPRPFIWMLEVTLEDGIAKEITLETFNQLNPNNQIKP